MVDTATRENMALSTRGLALVGGKSWNIWNLQPA